MPFPIEDFLDCRHVSTNTDATNQVAFIAPFDCDVVSVELRFRQASSSGTLDVMVSADGTSVSGGTSILTATMSLAGIADTKVTGSLKGLETGLQRINKGSALGFKFAGTLTNLLDLDITVRYRQTKKF